MDQHEPVYSYLYACKFVDQRWYELVAGYIDHFPGEYDRIDPKGMEYHSLYLQEPALEQKEQMYLLYFVLL
jgi:hypothetical protein